VLLRDVYDAILSCAGVNICALAADVIHSAPGRDREDHGVEEYLLIRAPTLAQDNWIKHGWLSKVTIRLI